MNSIQALKNLPPEIRSWLASESTAEKLRNVAAQLDLQGDDLIFIPHLLFRLVAKDLNPNQFAEAIGEWLNIPTGSAKTIAGEIKEKILTPITKPLSDLGVDITLINSAEDEIRRPVIAPLPSPPPIKISYKPAPPPVMGGSINTREISSTTSNIEKAKGKIHIIGDAHEHSANEKITTDDNDSGATSTIFKVDSQNKSSPNELRASERITLPATTQAAPEIRMNQPTQTEERDTAPFILHKETSFTPVSKEFEWGPPKNMPQKASELPPASSIVNRITPSTSALKPSTNISFPSIKISPATTNSPKPSIAITQEQKNTPVIPVISAPQSMSTPQAPSPRPPQSSTPAKTTASLPKIVNFDADANTSSPFSNKPPIINLKTDRDNPKTNTPHNQNQELAKQEFSHLQPPPLPPKLDANGNTVDLR